jgi:tetratricopeptide (TPR) repeat protein
MRLRIMAHLPPQKTSQSTLAARRRFEKEAAEALAGLAEVLMIDYLRGWNNATNINILVAEQAVQKACALDPSVALAHVAKGQIREVEGDLKGAIDAWDQALRLDPALEIAYAHKANALILRGKAEDALEPLETAISSPGADLGLLYWFKGRAYFHIEKYTDAIQCLKISTDKRPTTWFSWAYLISAYARTEQLQKRDQEAVLAVDKYRESFMADWPLDKIRDYYTQPKYRDARPQLDKALQKYFDGLEISNQNFGVPKKN